MSDIVSLPMGDLFRPYKYDDKGEIVQRNDTLAPMEAAMINTSGKGPDVAAILAAELAAAQDALAAKGK